ncbi:MAG: 50S ribosomal protein L18 [Chlamydiia bacterium]|nr:50S ribosomal protein L18 [Chlamydiia bacterium]
MESQVKSSRACRQKRTWRVRNKVRGNEAKPRLCVVKTNKNIIAQLIDDQKGVTLATASTLSKELKGTEFGRKNKESAKKLGALIAEAAKKLNIKQVVFDRGPFKYHGILAELANSAREAGLTF